MKRNLLLGTAASVAILMTAQSLCAEDTGIDRASINNRLAQLTVVNDDNATALSVIDSVEIDENLYFVVSGNKKMNKYMNFITSKNGNIGVVPSQILPINQEYASGMKEKLADMFLKINSEVFADNFKKVDRRHVAYFNGASSADVNIPIYLIDTNCKFCVEEISGNMSEMDNKKIPFGLLAVGSLGDESKRQASRILGAVAKKKLSTFNDYKAAFLSRSDSSEVDSQEDYAKIEEYTEALLFETVATGVPFKFLQK